MDNELVLSVFGAPWKWFEGTEIRVLCGTKNFPSGISIRFVRPSLVAFRNH